MKQSPSISYRHQAGDPRIPHLRHENHHGFPDAVPGSEEFNITINHRSADTPVGGSNAMFRAGGGDANHPDVAAFGAAVAPDPHRAEDAYDR